MNKKSNLTLRISTRNERANMNQLDVSNRICKNSKRKYGSGVKNFISYCKARKLVPIPIEANVSHFVSKTSWQIQPSSVNAYLTGIVHHFTCTYPAAQETRMSARVRDTVKGCSRSFSQATTRENAMTLADLEIAARFFHKLFNVPLFNVILALGFNGLHFLGKLVESDVSELRENRKTIKHWSLYINEKEGYVLYALPHSKADPNFLGIPIIIPAWTGSPICPLPTIVQYTSIRDKAFPTNPFWLLHANGCLPSQSWCTKRLQQVFGDSRSGHSLCAGEATEYAKQGVHMEIIQRMGRCKLNALESYIHDHPLLNLIASQQETQAGSRVPRDFLSTMLPLGKLFFLQEFTCDTFWTTYIEDSC